MRTESARGAVIANFAGRAVTALSSLVVVPIYLRLLGIEAYGLVGVFSLLTGTLAFLDLGLSKAITRELAVGQGRKEQGSDPRGLVRATETVYWGVALLIGIGVIACSRLIVAHWLKPVHLSLDTVRTAIEIMGALFAIQWPTSLYMGVLIGQQKQVVLNIVSATLAIAQGVTVVSALLVLGPSVKVFFLTQAVFGVLSIGVWRSVAFRTLPVSEGSRSRSRIAALSGIGRFAGGVTAISILSTVLTQLDKIVLTKMLNLEVFGIYTVAFALANAVTVPGGLVSSALFPRFAELCGSQDSPGLSRLYHASSQLIVVLVIPAAAVMMFFSHPILRMWTGRANEGGWMILSVAVVGSALNAVMGGPLSLQLSHGWTRLSIYKNTIAVAVIIPTLLLLVKHYGALGGAITWLLINAAYFFLEVPIMHRRLLPRDLWRWYIQDNLAPIAAAVSVVGTAHLFVPETLGKPAEVAALLVTGIIAVAAAGLTAPFIRTRALSYCFRPGRLIQEAVQKTS